MSEENKKTNDVLPLQVGNGSLRILFARHDFQFA